jgi:hypothetical protein
MPVRAGIQDGQAVAAFATFVTDPWIAAPAGRTIDKRGNDDACARE